MRNVRQEFMKAFCRVLPVLACLAMAATAPTTLVAQQTESRIMGRLLDTSGAALPGATVSITSKQTGAARAAVTGPDGAFVVTNLMTLAPGATSDGNRGWASVRFNGKSNQQNYLNYDGVDGTVREERRPRSR